MKKLIILLISAILLLPFVLLMLFLLSYGVGLILATMMVFFRDTQFLWGICSMLLMYLTCGRHMGTEHSNSTHLKRLRVNIRRR